MVGSRAMVRLLFSVFQFRVESTAFRWQYLSKRFKTKRAALVWTISTVLLVFLAVVDPTQTNSIPELGVLGPVCRFLSPRSRGNVNPL